MARARHSVAEDMLPAWDMYELDDVEGKEALVPTHMRMMIFSLKIYLRTRFAVGLECDGKAVDNGAEAVEREEGGGNLRPSDRSGPLGLESFGLRRRLNA
jgi:hypothetical protein